MDGKIAMFCCVCIKISRIEAQRLEVQCLDLSACWCLYGVDGRLARVCFVCFCASVCARLLLWSLSLVSVVDWLSCRFLQLINNLTINLVHFSGFGLRSVRLVPLLCFLACFLAVDLPTPC